MRAIQSLRKKIDLNVDDRIRLAFTAEEPLARAVSEHREYIAQETLALEIERSDEDPAAAHRVRLGGSRVAIAIEKVSSD